MNCSHKWGMYHGFTDSFEHCESCGLKKSEWKDDPASSKPDYTYSGVAMWSGALQQPGTPPTQPTAASPKPKFVVGTILKGMLSGDNYEIKSYHLGNLNQYEYLIVRLRDRVISPETENTLLQFYVVLQTMLPGNAGISGQQGNQAPVARAKPIEELLLGIAEGVYLHLNSMVVEIRISDQDFKELETSLGGCLKKIPGGARLYFRFSSFDIFHDPCIVSGNCIYRCADLTSPDGKGKPINAVL